MKELFKMDDSIRFHADIGDRSNLNDGISEFGYKPEAVFTPEQAEANARIAMMAARNANISYNGMLILRGIRQTDRGDE